VAAFIAAHPEVEVVIYMTRKVAKPLIFGSLLLFVGLGARTLFRKLVSGLQRNGASDTYSVASRGQREWWPFAVADILAWGLGLAIASEAIGLAWVVAVSSGGLKLIGTLVSGVVWLVVVGLAAGVAAYAFSEYGREIVLSLLGWYYIRRHPERPPKDYRFDLGDGREGTIVSTGLLHTTLAPIAGGDNVVVPNAEIMRQFFRWASATPASSGPGQ
jgi:hypothetical protein